MVAKTSPIMRLVKDDEDMAVEDMAANDESIATQEMDTPDRLRPGTEGSAAEDQAVGEAPDGLVEANDDAGAESASDPAIDLGLLEALLFGTQHPLTGAKLIELMGLKSVKTVRGGVKSLNETYESTQRSFRIEQVAGGYQMLTLPCFGEVLKKLHHREIDAKLTKSALETLAIIAYKQPILRADIEAIRGVACGETIRSLMEKHLVKIAGRAEEPGRPILYGTTKRFLELFGLNTLRDLPQSEDPLKQKA
jgi:segregation and condensation protein B